MRSVKLTRFGKVCLALFVCWLALVVGLAFMLCHERNARVNEEDEYEFGNLR